jgi:hypothetical protein
MNAVRIRKQIDSEMLHVPELRAMIGRTVDIIVLDETPPQEPLETRETFFARLPQATPATPAEREAELQRLKEMAKTDPKLAAFLEAVAANCLDVGAIIEGRGRE